MAQGILGRTLAELLAAAPGRHYVQLPQELEAEARALVQAANSGGDEIKAVLVVTQTSEDDPRWVVPASQLIAWRTDADRVFVLLGSVVEPDSSFATAASAFLTDAFPGTGGGSCTPAQLAHSTMKVALQAASPSAETRQAFDDAAAWAMDVLTLLLQDGSGSLEKLGSRLLRAWTLMASDLEDAVTAGAASTPPRVVGLDDAWEVFRLSGLPLPGVATSRPLPPPSSGEPFPGTEEDARAWQRFIDLHVRPSEVRSILEQLRQTSRITGSPRWTGLDWEAAQLKAQRFETTAPEIGRLLFASAPPSLVPASGGGDSWDAVTAGDLRAAMDALDQADASAVALDGGRLLPIGAASTGPFFLDVRSNHPTAISRGQTTTLAVDGVRLRFTGLSRTVADASRLTVGGALATKVTVKAVPATGIKVRDETLNDGPDGLELEFKLDLSIKDGASRPVRWTGRRKLEITLDVRDDIGGNLQEQRSITVALHVVVPSPYWPTVVALLPDRQGVRQLAVSPGPSVPFEQRSDGSLSPAESPELQLDVAANARLAAYDGRWNPASRSWVPPGAFLFSGTAVPVATTDLDYLSDARLVDQAVVQLDEDEPSDVTVIRVESDADLPTNTLRRADRTVPLHEPRPETRSAPFGRYQTVVADRLGQPEDAEVAAGDSLYQLVIPTGSTELPDAINFERHPTAASGAEGPWLGLGDGPSAELASTQEWSTFTGLAAELATRALRGGIPDWLSSMDLPAVGAKLVRRYIAAHVRLIEAAASDTDRFWARYPFSIFLVDGGKGPERGSLQAIFLSPIHPARVGWLFAAQLHGEHLGGKSRLLGLADGWNVPALGQVPGAAGGTDSLVAVPLDPGVDGDNVAWSSLVKTSGSGLVRPQLMAAGHKLPWGGRSGLTEQVVTQALGDYVAAHPHASSLQIELRATVEAPRSAEVDRAVVEWVHANAQKVGGIVRVLDSEKRLGRTPGRDDLPEKADGSARGRFTWLVRGRDEPLPGHVDIAFVENTAPFTRIIPGDAIAPSPALPLRRFPSALDNHADHVDYQHGARQPDLMGLNALLSAMEPDGATMRVVTTISSLQSEEAVRWEVIGDINLEPNQMARLASSGLGPKQLWEWRPGWLSADGGNTVRGAHYVLAQVPRSLLAGLGVNVGLTAVQAAELLAELGSRGIGLGTLRNPGSTQEGEAAGLFYAARLLTGFAGCTLPPGWLGEGVHAGIVPLDPIHGIVDALGGLGQAKSRADLALVVADRSGPAGLRLKVSPIECKHRGGLQGDGAPPSNAEKARAAEQVQASVDGLVKFRDLVAQASDESELIQASARLQTFATLVDLAMKFGPREPSPEERAAMVQDVVDGRFSLEVGTGVVVWSLRQAAANQDALRANDSEGKASQVQFIPSVASALVWTGHAADERLRQDRRLFDDFCSERFLPAGPGDQMLDLRGLLADALFPDDLGGDGPEGAGQAPDNPPTRPPFPTESGPVAPEASAETSPEAGTPQPPFVRSTPPASPGPQTIENKQQPEDEQASSADTAGSTHADLFLGSDQATRFTVVGKLPTTGQVVALDLDQPKAIGVFGYMGSGKSYLLGALIEGAAMPIPTLSTMRSPLAVVVFNYRRNAADRFELSSLAQPNREPQDVQRLAEEYGAAPQAVAGLDVLCLPGELAGRAAEYSGASARELYFDPRSLDVEDWELLMGEPGSDAVFARVIRSTLQDLRRQGGITVDGIRELLEEKLPKGSMAAAEIRLEAAERIVSASLGIDFGTLLRPGRVLAIDLRQPMFNRDDAMKLILVCANQIAKQRTSFNKLVVFDEAHEYMTEAFGERFDARIRYMRHEGSSYIFATQDVASVPTSIRRHLGTNFVFSLETRDNIADISKAAPEFAGLKLQHLDPGTCYATSTRSTDNVFRSPRLVSVRPRATAHGGQSRIFDGIE